MLTNENHRRHRSLLQAPKLADMFKKSTPGTLSPETTTTSSSGYSTGDSSISNNKRKTSLEKSSSISYKQNSHQPIHKTKSKGFHQILTRLKSFLLPTKTKPTHARVMRSATSREISSTNVLRQYHQYSTTYDVIPSSLTASNTISLPFTYYHNSPINCPKNNYEKISAWLDRTEHMTNMQSKRNDRLIVERSSLKTTSSMPSTGNNEQVVAVVMKNTPTNIRPPKRSSSLVARITRPILEQQKQKMISPASSFTSLILTKGMSERLTPAQSPVSSLSLSPALSPVNNLANQTSNTNRQRAVDLSRRRTIPGVHEYNSNKENNTREQNDIYRFSPSSSKNKVEIHIQPSKHTVTKQYYFHSYPSEPNDDPLNNSYGLTLLKQQKQQTTKPRHSVGTVLTISQVPNHNSSEKQFTPHTFTQHDYTLDSLDDLLCDREVESYFYPTSASDHIYMNLGNPSHSYQPPFSYIHETLC